MSSADEVHPRPQWKCKLFLIEIARNAREPQLTSRRADFVPLCREAKLLVSCSMETAAAKRFEDETSERCAFGVTICSRKLVGSNIGACRMHHGELNIVAEEYQLHWRTPWANILILGHNH